MEVKDTSGVRYFFPHATYKKVALASLTTATLSGDRIVPTAAASAHILPLHTSLSILALEQNTQPILEKAKAGCNKTRVEQEADQQCCRRPGHLGR